ncbi:hypothetical protein RJT34_25606 [Clitoria ternatea]|uniref:Uncharacterized protein n=1 Tax=Clitoria ternatea TaxID=43366 RepID=A0AAN9FQ42_CLITE
MIMVLYSKEIELNIWILLCIVEFIVQHSVSLFSVNTFKLFPSLNKVIFLDDDIVLVLLEKINLWCQRGYADAESTCALHFNGKK